MAVIAGSRLRQPGFSVGLRSRSFDDAATRVRDGRCVVRNPCRGSSLPPIDGAGESRLRQPKASCEAFFLDDADRERSVPPPIPRGRNRSVPPPPLPRGISPAGASLAWQPRAALPSQRLTPLPPGAEISEAQKLQAPAMASALPALTPAPPAQRLQLGKPPLLLKPLGDSEAGAVKRQRSSSKRSGEEGSRRPQLRSSGSSGASSEDSTHRSEFDRMLAGKTRLNKEPCSASVVNEEKLRELNACETPSRLDSEDSTYRSEIDRMLTGKICSDKQSCSAAVANEGKLREMNACETSSRLDNEVRINQAELVDQRHASVPHIEETEKRSVATSLADREPVCAVVEAAVQEDVLIEGCVPEANHDSAGQISNKGVDNAEQSQALVIEWSEKPSSESPVSEQTIVLAKRAAQQVAMDETGLLEKTPHMAEGALVEQPQPHVRQPLSHTNSGLSTACSTTAETPRAETPAARQETTPVQGAAQQETVNEMNVLEKTPHLVEESGQKQEIISSESCAGALTTSSLGHSTACSATEPSEMVDAETLAGRQETVPVEAAAQQAAEDATTAEKSIHVAEEVPTVETHPEAESVGEPLAASLPGGEQDAVVKEMQSEALFGEPEKNKVSAGGEQDVLAKETQSEASFGEPETQDSSAGDNLPTVARTAHAHRRPSVVAEEEEDFCHRHAAQIAEMLRTGQRALLQKRGVGGVGLLNQGATCYMNSLLQALFRTPEFRGAVYSFRYCQETHGETSRCIPLQLQKLFSQLQLSVASAVSTKALTTAFGFTAMDAMEQHDVQELCRVLVDALGRSSSSLAQEIDRLYAGRSVHVIRSREAHDGKVFESRREDKFLDLQVPIQDVATLEEALRRLLDQEVLDGDNSWLCEEFGGRIAALKGHEFESLPQIFCLQLNRFVFDYTTMRRRKLTDELSIPLVADFGFLLGSDAPSVEYSLMAICLHRGTAHGGHYHAYVQEPSSGEWYDANDSNVTHMETNEIEKLFPQSSQGSRATRMFSSADAYFLIYRQSSMRAPTMQEADVPEPHNAEMRKENQGLADLQRAYTLQRQLVEVTVFAPSASHAALSRHVCAQIGDLLRGDRRPETREAPQSITLTLSGHRTCRHVLEKAFAAFAQHSSTGAPAWAWADGLSDVSANHVRLRRCDIWCREPGAPISAADLQQSIAVALGQQPQEVIKAQACLQLELLSDGESFTDWEENHVTTVLCAWDPDLGCPGLRQGQLFSLSLPAGIGTLAAQTCSGLDPAHAAEEATLSPVARRSSMSMSMRSSKDKPSPLVSTLREAAAKALGSSIEDLALVALSGSHAGKELVDDGCTLAMCGVFPRDVICAEIRAHNGSSLQAVELYDRVLNTVHLKFNHPDTPALSDEHSVAISKSTTLVELKDRIAELLGLEAKALHLRRSRKSPQLKDEDKTIRQTGITDSDAIFVGHGAPCGKDECLLQIALYSKEKGVPKPIELFEHPVHCAASVRNLRETLVEPLEKWRATSADNACGWSTGSLVWSRLRLRDGQAGRRFSTLRDDRTLRCALPSLGDGRQVAVQILDEEETLGPDDFLIAVRPWRVLEGKLFASTEIVVDKTQSLDEFRSKLCTRFAGLLQKEAPEPSTSGNEEQKEDSLDIVIVPASGSGPPLTSQRCANLKWDVSPLNPSSSEALAAPLANLRDFRDGVTLIVRSRFAAAAAASIVGAETAAVAETPLSPKVGTRRRNSVPKVLVAAPPRRERSLRIEVVRPEEPASGTAAGEVKEAGASEEQGSKEALAKAAAGNDSLGLGAP